MLQKAGTAAKLAEDLHLHDQEYERMAREFEFLAVEARSREGIGPLVAAHLEALARQMREDQAEIHWVSGPGGHSMY